MPSHQKRLVATLIANPSQPVVTDDLVALAAGALGDETERTVLARGIAADLIPAAPAEAKALEASLRAALEGQPVDIVVQPLATRRKRLFLADMDSTMIGQECIDELADFAGIKHQIAAITERAMQGELDFEAALRERVMLLRDLSEHAILECLNTRIEPMAGAKTLVATLKSKGCRTILVTGGFHQFADPVAEWLGFERVVGNRLAISNGALTGGLVGPITDSSVKKEVLLQEVGELGSAATSMATGDGANDIPMLQAATYGIAYRAKPKARSAANGWVDLGDLTAILSLLGISRDEWINP